MKDIAEAMGVHRSTVSLALRNDPRLPAATRRRVQRVAERLGYRVNPLVAALMSHRRTLGKTQQHAVLGLITSFGRFEGWRESITITQMIDSARQEAERSGYRLEEFCHNEAGMNAARLEKILRARNVLGLIIAPGPSEGVRLELPWKEFAAVALGNTLGLLTIPRVLDEHFYSMIVVLAELRKMGYERIGYAMPEWMDLRMDRKWQAAFVFDQQRIPASWRVVPFVSDEWEKAAFAMWLRRERAEVIVGLPRFVPPMLEALGMNVPRDVGFASLDCQRSSGEMAGLQQNHAEVGATAVRLVVGMLQRNERGETPNATVTLIRGRWVSGRTVRARGRSRKTGTEAKAAAPARTSG